jgi:CRISPR/Cas system-associated protein endoribonuclease Cas2
LQIYKNYKSAIKSYLPPTGEVRMLILTEKQFKDCVLCQEYPDLQEKLVGAKDLVTLLK